MPRLTFKLVLFTLCLLPAAAAWSQDSDDSDLQSRAKAAEQAFQSQDWENVVKLYSQIAKEKPDAGVVWFRLGYALHALGRLDEAIPVHTRAADFGPFRPVALYNVGCAYALQGHADKAFAALDRSVQAGFRDRGQFEKDSDLSSLHADARWDTLLASLSGVPAPRRQFDFWVGKWNVLNSQGQQIGSNVISVLENGNIIHEAWTSKSGGTGQSMNYLDPSDGRWKQVWVDASGGVVRYEGEFRDGAMHFKGVNIGPNGQKKKTRASFTPLPDGRVRQFIEHSTDDGQTWATYFEGFYVKVGSKKSVGKEAAL